jgi:hypothetical protein
VLNDVKHQWNDVGNDIQTTRLHENDRIYQVAIDGATANRFSMPGTISTTMDGQPLELKEVSEHLTMEGIVPTLEHQRDASREVNLNFHNHESMLECKPVINRGLQEVLYTDFFYLRSNFFQRKDPPQKNVKM